MVMRASGTGLGGGFGGLGFGGAHDRDGVRGESVGSVDDVVGVAAEIRKPCFHLTTSHAEN